MAPVGDRPFLHHIVAHLANQGFTEIVMLTGYKHEVIERHFGRRYHGCSITYSREYEPLGTAGAVRAALDKIRTDQILLVNGDTFFPSDLELLVRFHETKRADYTMAVRLVSNCDRYGTVEFGEDYRITRFAEKRRSDREDRKSVV